MTIQAVIFDLDNTLTHRDLSIQAYCQHLARHYADRLSSPQFEQMTDIVRRIDNGGYPKKELLTHPSIGASVAYALLKELNWKNPPDLDELSAFWFAEFGKCAVAMPHVSEVLEQLKSQNYKLGIISNGAHETRMNIIQGLGIAHYFEVIVSSGAFGKSKPHPEIFLHTAQLLDTAPEDCLYIGDHPINDVQGAKSAGMQVLWLEGFHPEPKNKLVKIEKLTDIFGFLANTDSC
ncbi:hydrolase [Acinetobacter sp. NCu2D-2]|uniref:HAD family hydrolase n=1 Tax=Acinetobacter sp. NCu2D-2 TaxID=1608473 RepID=UPI0007CDFA96|nr:HAD family hydrolase [Acinetobacter sp. NCu2D-2]ANF81297.1 hydrolase [Acinetobacter sp. NCu2D-2]